MVVDRRFPGRSKARLFGCLAVDCAGCLDGDCWPMGDPVTPQEWEACGNVPAEGVGRQRGDTPVCPRCHDYTVARWGNGGYKCWHCLHEWSETFLAPQCE